MRDWLKGKLGLVLMGRAMLSKSVNQFSVDGQGCVPSLLFDLRPNYHGGNKDNVILLFCIFNDHKGFFFNLLIWIILTDFRILNQSYIFELNKTWSRYIIPSIYCWIHFVKLLKFLACAVFMRNTVEVFFSRNIFTWFWHQDEDSLLECVKKCSLLLIFPECLM